MCTSPPLTLTYNTTVRAKKMIVTLWEAKAEQFQAALSGTRDVPLFAVVSGLLAKKFAGNKTTPYFI